MSWPGGNHDLLRLTFVVQRHLLAGRFALNKAAGRITTAGARRATIKRRDTKQTVGLGIQTAQLPGTSRQAPSWVLRTKIRPSLSAGVDQHFPAITLARASSL